MLELSSCCEHSRIKGSAACQHRPNRSSQFVRRGGDDYVIGPLLQHGSKPWRVGATHDHGASRVRQKRAQVTVSAFADSKLSNTPSGAHLSGHQPSQAANSRPERKLCGSPIAATAAVAASTSMPGISLIAWHRKSASRTCPSRRSIAPICRSHSSTRPQCSRSVSIKMAGRRKSVAASWELCLHH